MPVRVGYSYRCLRPLVAYSSKRVEVADQTSRYRSDPQDRFCTFFTAQPLDETSCCIRICTARNFSPELTEADVHRRQDLVYNQDRDIVERSGPSEFPSICVRNCITAPIVWDSDTADGARRRARIDF